ncbi:MAG: DUF4139 domain-containing protein [Phycisphaerales bacterium]|nr:DUF4139 domain-containing protein [Phycisphaerales bacterium]
MITTTLLLATSFATIQGFDAPPVAVTVYPDRAWVERQVEVELAPGAQTIVVKNLPRGLLSDTLQASASGPAAVTDVQFTARTVKTPAGDRDELARVLDEAEDALLVVMNRLAVLESEQAFLEGMQAKAVQAASEAAGTSALDTAAIKQQMEFVSQQLTRVLDQKIAVHRDQERAQQAVAAAQSAWESAGGATTEERFATIHLQVARATSSTITVSALQHHASWHPVYDARINSSTGDVVLEYRAAVVQQTGEAWSDVEMTLSTAQPSNSLHPPSLHHWTLAEHAPPPPPSAGRGMRGRGMQMPQADAAVAENAYAFHLQSAVGGSPVNVTYTLPGRVDVPSDARADRRLQIGTTELDGELIHLSVPGQTEDVFLLAEGTNPGPYLLLPGEASLFVDGGFVGRASVASTAAGERVKLPFGPMPTLTAERSVETKRGTKGFFGDTSQFEQVATIVLENSGPTPVTVRVLDRRPVSQDERIKVEVKDLSDPLSTDPEYVRDEQPKGVLRWDIEVPAGAVGTTARIVQWTLDVRWPKDMSITGL